MPLAGSGTYHLKETAQAIEEYLAVSGPEHTPLAMPVKQTELPAQPSVLEISLKAMAEAVTQQTLLLQRLLEKVEQRPARKAVLSLEVHTCRGIALRVANSSQPQHQRRREMDEVRLRYKLPCGQITSS